MFAFLLFISTAFATKFFIIPKDGNYTIDDTPIMFLFDDDPSDIVKTYQQCYRDKGFHFKFFIEGEGDRTQKTYKMIYFTNSECQEEKDNRQLIFKHAADVEDNTEYTHDNMKTKFPLWVHFSTTGAGHDQNKIFQYSRPGCITPMGFEFRFTLTGCYHHLFEETTCDGEDTIAKRVHDGETWGSGIYHVNSSMVDGIDPKEELLWAEGDRGFFTYLNVTEVTKYTIYDGKPKYYQYTNDQLRIYRKKGDTYVYWMDAFRTPSVKKVLTTAIACPSRQDCTNSTEGWEYIITSECFAGQMFAYTCDQVVRLKEDGYEDNCDNILKKGKTEVVLSSDISDMFYYNETYFYVRQINIECPERSCNTRDGISTAYHYRETGIEKVDNNIINMTYQYLVYNYQHYTVQLFFDKNFQNVTGFKYIMPHNADNCIDHSDIQIYRHNGNQECENCTGYGVARVEYIELEKCIEGFVYKIHGSGFIGVYECDGTGNYSSKGNYDYNTVLQLIPWCMEIDDIPHFVWFDVSYSQFKNWNNEYTPVDSELCQKINPAPPPIVNPVPEPQPIVTSSDEVLSEDTEKPDVPVNPPQDDKQSSSNKDDEDEKPTPEPVIPPEDKESSGNKDDNNDKHSSGNKDDNEEDKQSSENKDDGEYPPNQPIIPSEDKESSGNKDNNEDKHSSGNKDDNEEDKESSGNKDNNEEDKQSSGNKDNNVESSTTQETPVTSESKTETEIKSESSKHEEIVDSEEEGGNQGGNEDGSHSILISALLVLMFFLF